MPSGAFLHAAFGSFVSFSFGFYLLSATFASIILQRVIIGRASNNIGLNKLHTFPLNQLSQELHLSEVSKTGPFH